VRLVRRLQRVETLASWANDGYQFELTAPSLEASRDERPGSITRYGDTGDVLIRFPDGREFTESVAGVVRVLDQMVCMHPENAEIRRVREAVTKWPD
jgi:hypothetical protein